MAESSESRQDRAMASLEVAVQADPRSNPFGIFAGDDDPHGPSMFHWYPSEADLFRSVAEDLPFVLGEDDDEEIAEGICGVLEKHACTDRLDCTFLSALQAELKGVQEVRWIGTFDGLCAADGEFERTVRADFRAEDDADGSPIRTDDCADFVEWLSEYGI